MSFHLHEVAPRQGFAWTRNGFRAFFRRPMALSSLFIAFMLAALLAMAVPAGGLLLVLALPLLSLGYMIATRSALAGGPVHPGQLIEPLRGATASPENAGRRKALLILCALYALATLCIIWLSDSIDGGRFERLQVLMASGQASESAQAEIEQLLADPSLRNGLLVRFGLAAVLAIPFWHAPALVWWGGQGVPQALFSSTLAVWRTKGAFLMYTAAWALVIGAFGFVAATVFTLLDARQLVGVAAMPAALMFTVAFYVSLYFSFVDTFGEF
ncbi:BPSS1780 family membrane protein [Aquincola sp. MAHUQ-54]|uniref:BPSS1780 family membrane protein n=1 Tax=Aquincola agrisoli TaxID=3119538 RepID=A0AAW9QDB0_9BURK